MYCVPWLSWNVWIIFVFCAVLHSLPWQADLFLFVQFVCKNWKYLEVNSEQWAHNTIISIIVLSSKWKYYMYSPCVVSISARWWWLRALHWKKSCFRHLIQHTKIAQNTRTVHDLGTLTHSNTNDDKITEWVSMPNAHAQALSHVPNNPNMHSDVVNVWELRE